MGASMTSSAINKQKRRSVTDAVDFAAGKLPNKQDHYHSIGKKVASREVATLRKDTLRLEQRLKTALNAMHSQGLSGSSVGGQSPPIPPSSPTEMFSELTGHLEGFDSQTLSVKHNSAMSQLDPMDPAMVLKYEGEAASMKIVIEEELKSAYQQLAAVVSTHSTRSKHMGGKSEVMRSAKLAAEGMSELNQEVWSNLITSLACCRYEQKHLDICVGELSEQVSVTAYEQGRLLAQMRVAYNENLNRSVSTAHSCLGLLEIAMKALGHARYEK
jgi:hypothetical protein